MMPKHGFCSHGQAGRGAGRSLNAGHASLGGEVNEALTAGVEGNMSEERRDSPPLCSRPSAPAAE